MPPRVSVLLPAHNRADVVDYAIRSVLAQTMTDFELLIVGDGCTDDTAARVARFSDARIRWFDLPKAPFSGYANRNIALRQATGAFIAYAQHDDLWFPDHLQLLLDTLDGSDAAWAYSRPLWVGSTGVICPSAVDLTRPDQLHWFMTVENSIPSTCVMHRRSAFDRAGYWPEDQAAIADWVCWQRIIRTASTPGAAYCRVPTSLHFRASWRDTATFCERAWEPASHEAWWPTVLNHPPADEPEQAVLWRAMAGDGDWTARVRGATTMVLDALAWRAIRELLPGMAVVEDRRTTAEAAAARAHAAVRAAHVTTQQALAQLDREVVRLFGVKTERDTALAKMVHLQKVNTAKLAQGQDDFLKASAAAAEWQKRHDALAVTLAETETHRNAAQATADQSRRQHASDAKLRAEVEAGWSAAVAKAARLQQSLSAATAAVAHAGQQRDTAVAQFNAATQLARGVRLALRTVLASTSWRATAPLRSVANALKRVGRAAR